MYTKNYSLKIETRSTHLFARVSGIRTLETVILVTTDVFNAALANHSSKTLIDVRTFEGQLNVFDAYLVVTQVFWKLRGKGIKKAAVVDKPGSSPPGWFLETAAFNRGFNFRIFASEEEALKWLDA